MMFVFTQGSVPGTNGCIGVTDVPRMYVLIRRSSLSE